jgi:hypothetical protein
MDFFKRLFSFKAKPAAASSALPTASDPARRAAIWRQVYAQGWSPSGSASASMPIVSALDFFNGNFEEGSIAANVVGMKDEPSHETFRQVLLKVAAYPEVQLVLVALDPEEESSWPYSDTVYILTTATKEQVCQWTAPLKPDDVSEGWSNVKQGHTPALQSGVHVWCLWWD